MITIELTGLEAKGLILNEGLTYFWKNKIDNARWEAVWNNDGPPFSHEKLKCCIAIKTGGEVQDLLMQSKNVNVPEWFSERVYVAVCSLLEF